MKCPRCQQDNPSHAKFCLECGASFTGPHESGRPAASHADLQRTLSESLEQQTATSQILRVISSSPTDTQPVFDAIIRNAVRLCGAVYSIVWRLDGDLVDLVAHYNIPGEQLEDMRREFPRRLGDDPAEPYRSIRSGNVLHIPDVEQFEQLASRTLARFRARGVRSLLVVPMLREAEVVGAIGLTHHEVAAFAPSRIELVKTFADQAVIAIENGRLFTELQEKNHALTAAHAQVTEALEQQTATSDILRVIASSPTDLQPVLDAVVRSAARLCETVDAAIFRVDGDGLRLVAHDGAIPPTVPVGTLGPAGRDSVNGRAFLEGQAIHVPDLQVAADEFPAGSAHARRLGFRATLVVPLMRENVVIGTIAVRRAEARPFAETQIELLKTFADQAVIAIENVRLFQELQQRNEALTQAHAQVTEALDQQTATAEILRVISQSQTDVQPVFDTIAANARRLCNASSSAVFTFDGELIYLAAQEHMSPQGAAVVRGVFPMPPGRGSTAARAILTRSIAQITEAREDLEYVLRDATGIVEFRSVLAVPMLRDGHPIGAVSVGKAVTGPFPDKQIALLQTFADQAVIAIENVRLFTELQASNRELTTALDTQTATSDILRVISRSRVDIQPVFDAIVESAGRLLRGNASTLTRLAGDQIELAAFTSTNDVGDAVHRARFPLPLHSDEDHGQAMRNRAPFNSADAHSDPRLPETQHASARVRGYRSVVVVPLLRHDEAIGTLGVSGGEASGFTDDEIALLKTFADQAVIAIENVRLLTELQTRTQELTRSVAQLTALGDVGRAVSSSLDLDTVLTTIVGRAVELSGADGGAIFEYDEGTEEFAPRATLNADESQSATLRATRLRRGEGAVGQMAVTREPIQIPDISAEGAYESRLRGALLGAGTRALLAIPLLHEDRIVGGLVVSRRTPGEFTGEVVEILKTFATQSALAMQNARLFQEIEEKSRQWRSRASTSPSSWPTCPTNCGHRSTLLSASPRC
jgi:two-component system, NtrC family, sensor kinase